jgi:hypothetical protein
MVLFRQVGLRHMLILPKYQAAGVSFCSEWHTNCIILSSTWFHRTKSIQDGQST